MSSTHINQPDIPHAQPTLPFRILEFTLVLLGKVANALCHLLVLLVNFAIMIITLGFPYLHYWIYKPQQDAEAHSGEMYYQMIGALEALWDVYSNISLPMFPLPFPMVSASGLPLYSKASFAAVMTLIVGVVSVATSTIYKSKFKALHNRHVVDEWLKASQQPWHKVPNKSFWVLLSLPAFLFFLSAILFMATAVLSVLERPVDGATPSPVEKRGCPAKTLHTFKNILFTTLAAAVAHFIFVITKIYPMTAWTEATAVDAV